MSEIDAIMNKWLPDRLAYVVCEKMNDATRVDDSAVINVTQVVTRVVNASSRTAFGDDWVGLRNTLWLEARHD